MREQNIPRRGKIDRVGSPYVFFGDSGVGFVGAFDLEHEVDLIESFFEFDESQFVFARLAMRRVEFVAQPRVFLAQSFDLRAQFVLFGFDFVQVTR